MPPDRDAPVTQALLRTFPGVSVVAVGDIVSQVGGLLGQMSSAIVAAASVAILAGIAVLIGASAVHRQALRHDNVMLKKVGARRLQVIGAQVLDTGVLERVLGLDWLVLGTDGCWAVIIPIWYFGWRR